MTTQSMNNSEICTTTIAPFTAFLVREAFSALLLLPPMPDRGSLRRRGTL